VRLDAGGGKGKGIFVTSDIKEGDLVFAERALVSNAVFWLSNEAVPGESISAPQRDLASSELRACSTGIAALSCCKRKRVGVCCVPPPLLQAGVQHAENKADVPACPHCFRAIGGEQPAPEGFQAQQNPLPSHTLCFTCSLVPMAVLQRNIWLGKSAMNPPPLRLTFSAAGSHTPGDAFPTAVTPEKCVADLLCTAIGRISRATGERDARGGGGGDSGSDDDEDDEAVDPLEAAQKAQLVRDLLAVATPGFAA
jgi:hypothetical protein